MAALKLLLATLLCIHQVLASCPESEMIECGTSDRCTRIRYICDGDNDCGDNSDEDSDLCRVWRNDQCERGQVRCSRQGDSNCVSISRYCQLEDPPCEGELDMRLCQILNDEKLQPLESIQLPEEVAEQQQTSIEIVEEYGQEFLEKVNGTLKHPDCPDFYTSLDGKCISIFFLAKVNWGEAQAFCKTIGGDLLTLHDGVQRFYTLVRHLLKQEITADFWIGGNLKNETEGWMWVDGEHMEMGSPYWALRHGPECSPRTISFGYNSTREHDECFNTYQAPEHPAVGHCAALTFGNYFYISDERCLEEKGVLCALSSPQAH